MNIIEKLNYYKNQISNNKQLEDALFWCDFKFDDDVDMEALLNCDGKSNYELIPFGSESCGGTYLILDNKYIGYATSEGECGIVAKNVSDFFNILIVCKNLIDYFRKNTFDSLENFTNRFNEINKSYTETLIQYADFPIEDLENEINNFIKENNFKTNIEEIYTMFKDALITEPSFIIECSEKNDTWYWDDLFSTEQEYINELRERN